MSAGTQSITSSGGLCAVVVPGGGLARLGTDDIELVQHAASAFEPGMLQLWLRDRGSGASWPLLGAGSGSRAEVLEDVLVVTGTEPHATDGGSRGTIGTSGSSGGPDDDVDGSSPGLQWRVTLKLHAARVAWAWHVEVKNDGSTQREIDVVHAHDLAVSGVGALRANELYVSQYLDVTPLNGPTGVALAVRQNLPQEGRHPWAVLAASQPVAAWATDALDVHGWTAREGKATGPDGDLPSRRRQHEHTLATLQTGRVRLGAAETFRVSFAGLLVDDHPRATAVDDVAWVHEALELARQTAPAGPDTPRPETAGPGTVARDPAAHDFAEHRVAMGGQSGPYDQGREVTARDLGDTELAEHWPGPWRAVERDGAGNVLSFFAGTEHVVTRAKELAVLRPHGTILRSGARARPEVDGLTVTAWMAGSPLSYLTRGHATTGRTLTTVRGYLGLHRAYGLRVCIHIKGRWRLLDLPSAFSMTPDAARWVYVLPSDSADPGGTIEIRTAVPAAEHVVHMTVRQTGQARRVLLAWHLATPEEPLPAGPVPVHTTDDSVVVRLASGADLALRVSCPVRTDNDRPLFDDAEHRADGVVTLVTEPVGEVQLEVTVRDRDAPARSTAVAPGVSDWWAAMTAIHVDGTDTTGAVTTGSVTTGTSVDTGSSRTDVDAGSAGPDVDPCPVPDAETEALTVSLPWLVRDALVHFLSPRGLEQFTGGAWGTRDVAQGPLELLLALDRLDDARALVLTVFAAQSTDGSWPQAFGFLPGDEHFRHEPPHGDVVHWPVLALGRYLLASGDVDVLDEPVSWYTPDGPGAVSPLRNHLLRALDRAREGYLPGTHLVTYGHGDWNDSLQPVDPEMASTMVSSWTVTLHHQSLSVLADGIAFAGAGPSTQDVAAVDALPPEAPPSDVVLSDALRAEAESIAGDLRRFLLVDGELAGYAQFTSPPNGQEPEVRGFLVHPRDAETGLRHGSLQMIHALGADLFDAQEAREHVALVREHLMGVDGVRLFDRPPGYHGGEMHQFQRAETATFVGREIGLMYVHAHLRWCEAMARWGDADALWLGLRQVLAPAALEVVPGAHRRQANTYASSSDAAVLDRVEFAERYAEVLTGATGLEGGWRVYSSGPGILLRILTQSFLGVRRRGDHVEIDPVLPARLDGLRATVPLAGGHLRLRLRAGPRGCGVVGVRLGDRSLEGEPTTNPYRRGGLRILIADLAEALRPGGPEVEVQIA